jgi:two-component system, response regulator YesN
MEGHKMIRVAIVDDEALERKALCKIIREHLPEVEVVAEAGNGRKAIEVADEIRPDLMMIDIKMPGIDGIEAVRTIKQQHPNMKFIIVSAFDTFEYAKQVMQQGVKEYLLKPSSKEDVVHAIQRVCAEIAEERRREQENMELKEQVHRLQELVEREWLSVFMLEEFSQSHLEEWSRLLGLRIQSGFFLLFKFPNDEKNHEWQQWLKTTIEKKSEMSYIMGKMMEFQVPVLLFSETKQDLHELKIYAQKFARVIIQLFQQEHVGKELYVGIGTPACEIYKLRDSYYEALVAVEYYASHQKVKSGFIPKNSMLLKTNVDMVDREKQLLEIVRQGDVKLAIERFQRYFQEVVTSKNAKLPAVVKVVEEMFILLERMLNELGMAYERNHIFHMCNTMDELKGAAVKQLTHIVQHVQAWRNSQANGKLSKAKEYIAKYYHRPLTLEEVAEYVELSPYYFSKLFKDRFGVTFIDYLTEIRIEKAKQEMMDHSKSLKEICFLVGYNDPNYFSRVFKKQTGLSPTEYRKSIHSAHL